MTNANWLLIILVIIVVALGGGWYFSMQNTSEPSTNPTSTPSTGTPTTAPTSTPQSKYSNADANMIVVDSPKQGASVANTFTVSGKARGNWYFEANFPLEVLSATGTRLVQSPVQATGEWMTTEFVPFTVQVTVPANFKGPAMLVLHNDNPSGLPQNDRSISIPIVIQ